MPIYLGNEKIDSIYVGEDKIKKIYVGDELVYEEKPKYIAGVELIGGKVR